MFLGSIYADTSEIWNFQCWCVAILGGCKDSFHICDYFNSHDSLLSQWASTKNKTKLVQRPLLTYKLTNYK